MNKILSIATLLISLLVGSAAQAVGQRPADMTPSPPIVGTQIFWCPVGTTADYKCTFTQTATFIFSQVTGDCTIASNGAIVCTGTNGTPFGTFATQSTPTGINGNCLQVNTAGVVSGAGFACGSGGGGTPGGSNGQVQFNNAGVFGGYTNAQLTSLVNLATASLSGALPAWPNTITTYFRGDGTYQTLNVAAVSGAAPLASPTFTGTVTFPITGSTQCLQVNTSGQVSGVGCPAAANPTALAGSNANNGVATTFMRSDASPAIQLGSATQTGIVQVDNTTIKATAGVISSVVSGGTVTSVGSNCGITGGPITTTGTLTANATINLQTGTSYTIQSTDCGLLLELSNAGAVAVSLPQAIGSFAAGWYSTVINEGAGTATITPTTSTIDGSATLTLAQFSSVDIISNGTNYITARGRSGGSSTITAGSTATSGITSGNILGSTSNLVVDTGVAFANLPLINGSNVFTGVNTFAEVLGKVTVQSGATYTFAATDCGTEVTFTGSSAITATIPATLPIGCNIAIAQIGTAKVSVNGSAVTPATLHSAHSYTGTSAQYAVIGVNIEANAGGSAAIALLTGDGS